jgi:hypothetical protein
MDIFAHTLWASAIAKEANKVGENKKFRISVAWSGFWGVFPDLFAFTIPFFGRFYLILFGGASISSFAPPGFMNDGLMSLAQNLYQYSHSLVIWAFVFMLIWIFYRRPRYELLGWALHILIDIPSHTTSFFPTPFLFPLSSYVFPYGVSWGNYWYMVINYSLLLAVWGYFLLKKTKINA